MIYLSQQVTNTSLFGGQNYKKSKMKRTIILGILCLISMSASVAYSVLYNDSRLVAPMRFSEYEFRTQDLPMIISGVLLAAYVLYLLLLLVPAIMENKRNAKNSVTTRKINPKMGLIGFFGFFGFLGFWTYCLSYYFYRCAAAGAGRSDGESGIYIDCDHRHCGAVPCTESVSWGISSIPL